jgi:hypothetical protein
MNEKTLDLKGEEETPTNDGQSVDTSDDTSEETTADNSEEKVELSKEEYEKLLEDKENYKKGLMSYKEKVKEQPKEQPKDDVLTKTDFHKINEKKAIDAFLKDNPEVDGKWSDFISFYRDSRGRNTVEDIVNDLDDAKTLFLKHNPVKEETDNQTKANLTSEKGLESSSSDDKKPQKTSNKFLDARGKPITEWYK